MIWIGSDEEPAARYRVRTETGSVYEIDNRSRRWFRHDATMASGMLRSTDGDMARPVAPVLGLPLVIVAPSPFAEGCVRIIRTSPVVSIEELADGPEPGADVTNPTPASHRRP
jgi:hypothetical protein